MSMVLVWLVGASVGGQEPAGSWLLDATRMTGDWGGARSSLEERGVRLSLYYVHYYGYEDDIGSQPVRRGRHSGSADLFGQFDFGTMGVIPGGEALIHVKNTWSRNINAEVGALGDPIDDADGDQGVYIDQLWYQQSSPGRTLQVRLGYLDQQTILDRNAFANSEDRQFMSTFLDNNNAVIPLAIGPGVAVLFNPAAWLSVVATISDARSRPPTFSFATALDGEYFAYVEADLKAPIETSTGPLAGNYRFGLFLDPRDRPVYGEDRVDSRNEGFYLSVDQMVYGESTGDDQGLGLFGRYGWRPADVNRVSHFWSAGAQYTGLMPHGEQHTLGVGAYSAIGSDRYRTHVDPTFDRETAYELYYAFQVGPAFVLTPAVQYIDQPGALTTRGRVVVFAIRGRISL